MFVPLGFTFALGSAVCRRLGHRVRIPIPVAGAALIATVLFGGALIAQLPQDVQPPLLVVIISLAGFGQGLVVTPTVAGILSRVTPTEAGAASGMATTVTQVGLALGVAVAGVCYRTVLGATPGDPGVPFADHAMAFTFAALLLAALATATSLLSARLHHLPARLPEPTGAAVPVTQKEAATAATN
jgi:MFS family permease